RQEQRRKTLFAAALHHHELSAAQVGARHEIRLGIERILKMTYEVPSQAEINCQLGAYLPIVLEVRRIVIPCSIGSGNIRCVYGTGTASIVNPVRNSGGNWCQERLSEPGVSAAGSRHLRIRAVEIPFPARPSRLEKLVLYVLKRKSTFQSVLAGNLGKVLCQLETRGDLPRGVPGGRSHGCKSRKTQPGESPVQGRLRNALDPKLAGYIAQVVGGRLSTGCGYTIEARPQFVNHGRRKRMRPTERIVG